VITDVHDAVAVLRVAKVLNTEHLGWDLAKVVDAAGLGKLITMNERCEIIAWRLVAND
jgi:hypothetical protein